MRLLSVTLYYLLAARGGSFVIAVGPLDYNLGGDRYIIVMGDCEMLCVGL